MANPELFIKSNPPPENVWWCAERQCFIGVASNHRETMEYNNRFSLWQAQYDSTKWAVIPNQEVT